MCVLYQLLCCISVYFLYLATYIVERISAWMETVGLLFLPNISNAVAVLPTLQALHMETKIWKSTSQSTTLYLQQHRYENLTTRKIRITDLQTCYALKVSQIRTLEYISVSSIYQTHTYTHTNPAGLLWTSDQLVAKAAAYATQNKQKKRTSTPSEGFEPAITAIEREYMSYTALPLIRSCGFETYAPTKFVCDLKTRTRLRCNKSVRVLQIPDSHLFITLLLVYWIWYVTS